MLNRTIPPIGKVFQNIPLPNFTLAHLSNGVPVYMIQYGTVEMCEVQAIFKAGAGYGDKVGVSDFTPRNMSEGTKHYTSLAFSQALDNYGAFLEYEEGNEFISFNLTTLSHLLGKTLPLMQECLVNPLFPETEWEKLKSRTLQKLQVSQKQTSYKASKEFPKLIFGANHGYATTADIPEIQAIERNDLVAYYEKYLHAGNLRFAVTGRFDEADLMRTLEAQFGSLPILAKNEEISATTLPVHTSVGGRYHFEVEGGVQSSIRVGHLAFSRLHPDYDKMELVNTILGGYFGSRLMKNIREDKGYTYGIYSGWGSYLNSGVFSVQCDVGNEYIEDTLFQIKKEINALITDGVTAEELDLVRNYKLGQSINQRETPGQINKILRFSLVYGISFAQLDQKYENFNLLKPADISALAAKYIQPENLIEVVCGSK